MVNKKCASKFKNTYYYWLYIVLLKIFWQLKWIYKKKKMLLENKIKIHYKNKIFINH